MNVPSVFFLGIVRILNPFVPTVCRHNQTSTACERSPVAAKEFSELRVWHRPACTWRCVAAEIPPKTVFQN
jgi:hypothetical protein